MIPIPPARAMVMAIACSVTVSIGALTIGVFNCDVPGKFSIRVHVFSRMNASFLRDK